MSLGWYAAVVVKLQADGKASVQQLATYLAVDEARVRQVLRDIHAQGHCTLWGDSQGLIVGAQWTALKQGGELPCA
ncbi:MAG: hypothetical protein RJA10_1831 [Pseudomonadota bacterium]|jgi:hypothetical protein